MGRDIAAPPGAMGRDPFTLLLALLVALAGPAALLGATITAPTAAAQGPTATMTTFEAAPMVLPGEGGLVAVEASAQSDVDALIITLRLEDPTGRVHSLAERHTLVARSSDTLGTSFDLDLGLSGPAGWWTVRIDRALAIVDGEERTVNLDGPQSERVLRYGTTPVAGTNAAPWPQAGGDPMHTGRTLAIGPEAVEVVRWRFTSQDGQPFHTPVIGPEGTIYAVSWGGQVYAVDGEGAMRWSRPLALGDQVPVPPAVGPNGNLLVVTENGRVHSISSGREVSWTIDTTPSTVARSVHGGPVVDPTGRIHVVVSPWSLVTLSANGGRLNHLPLEPPGESAPGLPGFPEPHAGPLVAVMPNGTPYVVSGDGISWIAPNGSVGGTISCGCSPRSVSLAPSLGIALIAGEASVVAVSTNTGRQIWTQALEAPAWHPPAISWNNEAYIVSEDGRIHRMSLEGDRGRIGWRNLFQPIRGQPVVDANGNLYLSDACQAIRSLTPGLSTRNQGHWVHEIDSSSCSGISSSLAIAPSGGILWPGPDGVLRMLGSNRPPVPAFNVTWDGQAFVFDASLSSDPDDPDGTNLTYSWEIGDDIEARGLTVSPTLPRSGNYSVSLTVRDGLADSSITRTVNINFPPQAVIVDETRGLQVQLNASATVDPEGDPVSYNWTVDGQPRGNGSRLAFRASQPHVFDVQLEASDGRNSATSTRTILAPASSSWNQETITLIPGDCPSAVCTDPSATRLVEQSLFRALVVNGVGRTVDVHASLPTVTGGTSDLRLAPGQRGTLHLQAGGVGEETISVSIVGSSASSLLPITVEPRPAEVTWRIQDPEGPVEAGNLVSIPVHLNGTAPPRDAVARVSLLVDDEETATRRVNLDQGEPVNTTVTVSFTPQGPGEQPIRVTVESLDPSVVDIVPAPGEEGTRTLQATEPGLWTTMSRTLADRPALAVLAVLVIGGAIVVAGALWARRKQPAGAEPDASTGRPGSSLPDGDATVASSFMPRKVERFHIERVLGEGGFGRTYLAQDTVLERPVVLKELEHVGQGEARELLLHEARTAANLAHPNVVVVHDVIEEEGRLLIVMEYVEGGTLAERLEEPIDAKQTRTILTDILEGLKALHEAGIVHRDLKPSNILITPEGVAKITDFGVAARIGDAGTESNGDTFVGTPRYMAPEQLAGDTPGPPADIYAVGTLLYQMLTREHPLGIEDPSPSVEELLDRRPALPVETLDKRTNAILERALARDPADRFDSAAVFLRALRRGTGDTTAGASEASAR